MCVCVCVCVCLCVCECMCLRVCVRIDYLLLIDQVLLKAQNTAACNHHL